MAVMQAEDIFAYLQFAGDLNGYHQEWLGYTTTNRHGVAVFDFATVSGCDQLVAVPAHVRRRTLDLLVRVAVVAPIGDSDLFPLSAVISTAQAVLNLIVC